MQMQKKKIASIDIFRTLNRNRTNKDISRLFGISYSQLTTWMTKAEDPAGKSTLSYFTYILLEYFRRVDDEQIAIVMEANNLVPDVDDEFLETYLFSPDALTAYLASSLDWKSDLVDRFYKHNSELFQEQIYYLQELSICQYQEIPEKSSQEENYLSKTLGEAAPKHI